MSLEHINKQIKIKSAMISPFKKKIGKTYLSPIIKHINYQAKTMKNQIKEK